MSACHTGTLSDGHAASETSREEGVAAIADPAVPCSDMSLPMKSGSGQPVVCFSNLQYCDILIEGHSKPVTALKDQGAEICLIRENFVRGWETSSAPISSVRIRGVLGEAVEATDHGIFGNIELHEF